MTKNAIPALEKLQQDQEEIIQELREGFDTAEAFMKWIVKTNIRTLGQIQAEYYESLYSTRIHLAWLLGRQIGSMSVEIEPATAHSFRKDVAATVSKAANRAYRLFRERANEYTEQEFYVEGLDAAVAFRPALQELEEKQWEALAQGRYGLSSRDELMEWERSLQSATYGEFDKQYDRSLANLRMGWDWSVLTQDVGKISPARDMLLLDKFLPAFVRGVRVLAFEADELVDDTQQQGESLDA